MTKLYNKIQNKLRDDYPLIHKNKTVVKYLLSGTIAVSIDFLILFTLTDLFGLWAVWSASIAYVITFYIAFNLQSKWTFRNRSHEQMARQMFLFFIVAYNKKVKKDFKVFLCYNHK